MNKIHKLLLLIVLFSLPCGEGWGGVFAQNPQTLDSLQKVYPKLKADTSRILTLIEIAFEYRTSKPDTTLLLAEKALKQAQKIKYQKGIAWAWNRIGSVHFNKGDFDKSLEYA